MMTKNNQKKSQGEPCVACGCFNDNINNKEFNQPETFSLRSELYCTVYKIKKIGDTLKEKCPSFWHLYLPCVFTHSFRFFLITYLYIYAKIRIKENQLVYHYHVVLSISYIRTYRNNYLAFKIICLEILISM